MRTMKIKAKAKFMAMLVAGLFVSAAALFVSAAAQAQNLQDALAQMLGYNSTLLGAYAQYDAQYMEQFITLGDMLPQITAYAQETRSDGDGKCYRDIGQDLTIFRTACENGAIYPRFNTQTDSDGYGIEVRQELFTSGKNLNAFRAKRAEIRAAQQNLIQTEQRVILQAITAYLDVLRAESILKLNQKNEAVLAQQLESVRDRFKVGVGTSTDIAQSEAVLASAQSARLNAQSGLSTAKAVYVEIFGVPPSALQQPAQVPRLPRNLDRAQSDARRDSPVLSAAQEMATMGRFQIYSTVGNVLPSITLSGTYAYNEDPNGLVGVESETTSLVARLNVPIFRGGKSFAAVSASSVARQALLQNVHSASRALDRDVTMAWHNYLAAAGAIMARQQQINASQAALEGVRQENSFGTRTTLDVLNAEQALLDARVGLVEAQRNQQVTAYALLASIGHLTRKKLRIKASETAQNNQ